MKITTFVMATALAISSGCAVAAGTGTPGAAAGEAAGKPGGSAGARAGVAPRVAAPGVAAPNTTPGTTTGMGTGTTSGAPATPGLNANGPCNGASSTTAGGAC
jgi:hypothetical protein